MTYDEGEIKIEALMRRQRPRRSIAASLLAVALALAVSGALAPNASAGNYSVQECFFGGSAPDAVYSTNGSLAFTPDINCSSLSGVGVGIGTTGSGWGGPLEARWTFYAPSGTFIDGVNFSRSSHSGGTYSAALVVCGASLCNGIYSDTTGGSHVPGGFGPGGWTRFYSLLQCSAGTCNAGGYVYVTDLVFTMTDVVRPAVTSLGGSLLGGVTQRGIETLDVGASDAGAGVRGITVKVNGAQIASRTLGCDLNGSGIAARMRPCGSAAERFAIDTEGTAWVAGQNRLEVCAQDYSGGGPTNEACETRIVTIDNSCPNSAGGPRATSLEAGLQKQGPTTAIAPQLAVRSNQGATVRGELDDSAGAGVAGANVCLYETIDTEGAVRQLAQVTKTKSDGSFAVQVEPGPSRRYEVAYRYSNHQIEKGTLYLDSAVKPSFRLRAKPKLRNGQNVGFLGAVPGPNAAGRVISMQARVGKKWRTFKQLKANAKGKFKGRYKFTSTRGRVLYRFRARVKRQGNYPYSPGSSKVRQIRVRG